MKRILLTLTLLLALTACHRIPMHEAASGVYLKLTLKLDPDVAPGEYVDLEHHPEFQTKVNPKRPEMVRALFYNVDSHELVSEDFLPVEGGFVDIAPGVYDVLVYSLGTEVTQVEGAQMRASGDAFTSRTGTRLRLSPSKATGDEELSASDVPVIYEPDHLFAGKIAGAVVPVRPEDLESDMVVLETELKRVSETWSLEFIDIEGAERITGVEVYLTGQADGRYLWDGRTQNHQAALSLNCAVDVPHHEIYSVLNTFGKYPEADCDVLVNVMLSVAGGERVRYIFNVTDQWLNPDNTAHRIVITDPVDVPTADYSGGGFDPVVNVWDGEEIDVIIG